MISVILHESWLGEVVAGQDRVRKLNAFEECYLACYCYKMKLWCNKQNTWLCIFAVSLG